MNRPERVWSLQNAKAKFSEVVRLAQLEGPQTVTVHGKATVVIIAADQSDQPTKKLTGRDLRLALQSHLVPDFDIPDRGENWSFRDVDP